MNTGDRARFPARRRSHDDPPCTRILALTLVTPAAAQQHSPALAELRGGFEISDDEFKWLAIGAGIVLILVLI